MSDKVTTIEYVNHDDCSYVVGSPDDVIDQIQGAFGFVKLVHAPPSWSAGEPLYINVDQIKKVY